MSQPDPTRWLHKHSELGYTSDPRQALPHEPPALNPSDLEDITARTQRRRRQDQIAAWKQERAQLEQSLDRLYAQRLGHDITTQLRALQRQLDRIDIRLHR